MKKLMIFIDAEHVTKTCRENDKYLNDINWKRLIEKITRDRELIRCYYYTALNENNKKDYESTKKYHAAIKQNILPHTIEFRLGKLKPRENGGSEQKGVDVKLAIDMLTKAFRNQYDVAAVVTGDLDFKDLIEEVKNSGKKVELYYMERRPNKIDADLLHAADISAMIKYSDISVEQNKSAPAKVTAAADKPEYEKSVPKNEPGIQLLDIVINALEANPKIYDKGSKEIIDIGLLCPFITKSYFNNDKIAIAKFLKDNGEVAKKIDSRIFQRFPKLFEMDKSHSFMKINKGKK